MPVVVGQVAPRAGREVVAAALPIVVLHALLFCQGELIDATAGDGGCRLAAQQVALAQTLVGHLILLRAVVHARHFGHLGKARVQGVVYAVHAVGDGARLVVKAYLLLQVAQHLGPVLHALFGYFVAHAPHHDAGVQAVGLDEVLDVAVAPLPEEAGVAVLALWIDPHVEALGHDHHAERVAQVHLHLRGHVVGRADGIAAHGLQQLDLADEGGFVDGGTQEAEVVVQTDTLDFA